MGQKIKIVLLAARISLSTQIDKTAKHNIAQS